MNIVKMIDTYVQVYLSSVRDMTPVNSRSSLNSVLSAELSTAASTDDEEEVEIKDESLPQASHQLSFPQPAAVADQSRRDQNNKGSFRTKGPKLTIKVPSS